MAKRRKNGEGMIRKRSDGRLFGAIRFELYTHK